MAKKVGVLLAGCGVMDGAEIHEAVLTLLALDRAGAQAACLAPGADQMHVVNHLTGQPSAGERRNCLVEAARIARGKVQDVAQARAVDLDALIVPGGFGAAKNLCDYAVKGAQMSVRPEVERLLREMNEAGKPLGFICIAPVIAAKVFGRKQAQVTVGNDPATAADIESWGARHVACPVEKIHVDKALRIVSTPAYMLARRICEAEAGITALVTEVLKMA